MFLRDLVETSDVVARTSGRLQKIARVADLLRRADPEALEIAVAFLTGSLRQGRIGIGGAMLREIRPPAVAGATLTLRDVDDIFEAIASAAGKGSAGEKGRLLRGLMARATLAEQDFLVRLLYGELRQGALGGVMAEAIARATEIPPASVRRAAMAEGDLGAVAAIARREGRDALDRVAVRIFRPVRPMLAQPSDGMGDAMTRLGEAALEYKLDGARVQIHKEGDIVRVYSRTLIEVTQSVPEIVESVRALPARSLILDGEAIALRPGGTPYPFQVTMRRFGRKLDVGRLREELPLSIALFDLLFLDGSVLIDEPLSRRAGLLNEQVGSGLVVPRISTHDPVEGEQFLARAIAAGHEGIMAKSPDAPYEAGSRGSAWLKIKRAETLDLVVLAAEWGNGRRSGWLSNLHLGARVPARGGFAMLGKTFKGMTDEMLAWQTRRLLDLELGRDGTTVHVRPELVVEIAFSDVQESPRYPEKLALRFARVKRFRLDKSAGEADTIDRVREIHRRTAG